jgi:tryptophan synthase beta chain
MTDKYDMPDARGHFGPYGGIFVAETLMPAITELNAAYQRYLNDAEFIAELDADLRDYVGRPSPLYQCTGWRAGLSEAGRLKSYRRA